MHPNPPTRILAATAQEICDLFEPEEEALALLQAGMTPQAFLAALEQAGECLEAVRFLAYALPKREVVWWTLGCVRERVPCEPDSAPSAALAATEAWVMDTSEQKRRAALVAAETTGFEHPAGCLALSAFLSGGSLAPEGLDDVPPGELLTAQTASGALLLAAVREPASADDTARAFLMKGLEIATTPCPWEL